MRKGDIKVGMDVVVNCDVPIYANMRGRVVEACSPQDGRRKDVGLYLSDSVYEVTYFKPREVSVIEYKEVK